MKTESLMDAGTAQALQAAWLMEEIAPVSEFGRRHFETMQPFRPGEERAAQQRSETIARLAAGVAPEELHRKREALRFSPDPAAALVRASMGEVLDDAQFLEMQRFLDAAAAAEGSLTAQLRDLRGALEPGRTGTSGFYLADAFDPALGPARNRARTALIAYESARNRLGQRVARDLHRDDVPGGEFIVMREGIARLPAGVRVVREAPTYYLCEVDLDDAALEALRERDAAGEAAAAAEERARAALSERVRAATPALEALLASLAALDVDLALAHFTQTYRCAPASIAARSGLEFTGASFLPLAAELARQARTYEPIAIELSDVAVLTGPNMGGKSAALKTCGFIALLAAFGIPVPARRARCELFESIAWLGIGAHEDTGGLLSSFAAEIVRLNEILAKRASSMLLLADEFARTTTPQEAKALLVALAQGLRRRGARALLATHLTGVARQARAVHLAVRGLRELPPAVTRGNLREALDALAASMDYSITQVDDEQQTHADAIALAELLGLDEDMVADAKEGLWTR
jgi:DNA mismatch repair protein MutS2